MQRTMVGAALALLLASCATEGRVYERERSEAFRLGVTSASDAIAALGQPDMDFVRPVDNVRIVRWSYRKRVILSVDEYVLAAHFDPADKLIYLHNPAEAQRIDPF